MVRPYRDDKGALRARKRIPDAVRDEYARLYSVRHEAKFYAPPDVPPHEQRRRFSEWLSEVEGRIAAITAARKGEGVTLTKRDARALAGAWYEWFTSRHPHEQHEWDELRDRVQSELRANVSEEEFERPGPDALWRDREDVRAALRPVLADIGETAQFLAAKQLMLNGEAHALFLDYLYEDLAAALRRVERLSQGDYSPDRYRERFPKLELTREDASDTPWQLFQKWVAAKAPAQSTVESWRYPLRDLTTHLDGRAAASILTEEADAWIRSLVTSERSARTVKKTWFTACNTVFGWAVGQKHVPRNPFTKVAPLTIPRAKHLRETKAFHPHEWNMILAAASAIRDATTPDNCARRWLPWLCAYTGARPGEIAQLRGSDVVKHDGVHAVRLTPDAGTVKGGRARAVPLHEHLIAQGFLAFVQAHGKAPLFYKPTHTAPNPDPTKQRKPRSAQTRQRIAAWVRELGVDDPALQPSHAWRHTFKRIADSVGISERMSDYITGHAHRTEGARYGAPTLSDMAAALTKFPRFEINEGGPERPRDFTEEVSEATEGRKVR
jgi:integrase